MKHLIFMLALGVLTFITACSSPIKYGSDYNTSANFGAYNTYSWHAPNAFNEASNAYIANDLVDQRIRSNIDKEMLAKGLTRVAADEADILLNYSITTEEKVDIRTYNTYNGMSSGWGYGPRVHGSPYRYYGLGYANFAPDVETKVSQYRLGTLVIDVVSSADGQLIWRGTAEGKLKKNALTASERNQKIAEIVTRVLGGFPPK